MTITRVVQDGVEFFTRTETGESGISESGVARLCNVSHQAISKLLDRLVATKQPPKSLEAFAGKNVRLQLKLDNRVGEAHTRIVWLPSEVVAGIVEYYAFESRNKTAEALFAYPKFAKMGIERWIQSITGWSNEPIEPPLPDLTLPREAVRILKNSQETKTAYRLFLYLHDVGQQGERPTIAKICKDLEISRPTFHKTAKRLQELKVLPTWFELESQNEIKRLYRQTEATTTSKPIEPPT